MTDKTPPNTLAEAIKYFASDEEKRKQDGDLDYINFQNRLDTVIAAATAHLATLREDGGVPTDAELRKFGYAKGDYTSPCWSCDGTFNDMDKQCRTCRDCAVKAWEAALKNPSDAGGDLYTAMQKEFPCVPALRQIIERTIEHLQRKGTAA